MTKRIEAQLNKFVNKGESAKFTLGTLVLMGFCGLLIIISTFTLLSFTHPIIPLDIFSSWDKYFTVEGVNWQVFFKHYKYIPQIPVIFFILSLLDRKFATLTIAGYIVLGLIGYPIFALGGGWRYIFEYGFYYILGYMPALFFAGSIMKQNYSFINVIKSVFVGVLIVHLIGSLGMIFVATLKHESSTVIGGWILTMSGMKIFYDMFFSIVSVYVGQIVKRILWIVMS